MSLKYGSAIRALAVKGAQAFKPTALKPVDGRVRWGRPLVSKRMAADLRKLALRNGTYGSFSALEGRLVRGLRLGSTRLRSG